MTKAEKILYLNISDKEAKHINEERFLPDRIVEAMEKYAILYHEAKVKNSRLDGVSDSKPVDTFENAISFLKNEMNFSEEEIENVKKTGKEKVMEFINDLNSR